MKIKGLNRRNQTILWTMYQKRARLMLGIKTELTLQESITRIVESAIESKRHYYPRQNAKTICEEYFKRKSKRKNTQNVFL